jgi:hypothetical protein
MAHLENVPTETIVLNQIEDLFRQSLGFSGRILREFSKANGFGESEARDLILAAGPTIASDYLKQVTSVAQIIERASQSQIDEMVESMEKILVEIRRRNKSASTA